MEHRRRDGAALCHTHRAATAGLRLESGEQATRQLVSGVHHKHPGLGSQLRAEPANLQPWGTSANIPYGLALPSWGNHLDSGPGLGEWAPGLSLWQITSLL